MQVRQTRAFSRGWRWAEPSDVAADADDEDDGTDGEVERLEQVDFVLLD